MRSNCVGPHLSPSSSVGRDGSTLLLNIEKSTQFDVQMTDISITFASAVMILAMILAKFFKNKKIELVSLLLAVLFIILGIVVDFHYSINPLGNLIVPLLAELAGIFIGVLVALGIVDKYKDRLRRQEWAEVKDSIYGSILTDLISVALGIYSSLPIPGISYPLFSTYSTTEKDTNRKIWAKLHERINIIPEAADKINMSDRQVIAIEDSNNRWRIIDMPDEPGSYLAIDKDTIDFVLELSHKKIRPYLDDIKNVQIPRVMSSPIENEILSKILNFEKSISNYYIMMQHFSKNSDNRFIIKSMIKLCEDASSLYKELEGKLE